MRMQITLYGDDAQRFAEAQARLGRDMPGSKPGNAEAVRMMMDLAGY